MANAPMRRSRPKIRETIAHIEITVVYAVDAFENSCRPDADPCIVGTSCDDGHGLPYYCLSALMIAYR